MKSNLSPLGIQPTDLADPRKLVRKILEIARKRFRVERAALYLYNPNLGDLEIDMALGVGAESRAKRVDLGKGVVGWVASRGAAARADLHKTAGGVGKGGSEMAAPLNEGESLLGVIAVGTKKKNFFVIGQEGELAAMAQEATHWLELARRLERRRHRLPFWEK